MSSLFYWMLGLLWLWLTEHRPTETHIFYTKCQDLGHKSHSNLNVNHPLVSTYFSLTYKWDQLIYFHIIRGIPYTDFDGLLYNPSFKIDCSIRQKCILNCAYWQPLGKSRLKAHLFTSSAVITLLVSPPSSCLSVRKRTPAVGSLLSCGSLLMS